LEAATHNVEGIVDKASGKSVMGEFHAWQCLPTAI
jgi:hypothetical protein